MSAAAERFAGMLGPTATDTPRPVMAQTSAVTPRRVTARLSIRDGLHAGAWLSLRGERLRVGSDERGDIVLLDPAMPALAALLVHAADGWQLHEPNGDETCGDKALQQPAVGSSVQGRWRRRRWLLHGVTLVVIDAAPVTPVTAPAKQRVALRLALVTLVLLLAISGLMATTRDWHEPARHRQLAEALPSLEALGLPDVKLGQSDKGEPALTGHVADRAQMERLLAWRDHSAIGDVQVQVQIGEVLAGQVRDALGNAPEARVAYLGAGRVRIDGSTPSADVKRRVQLLVREMRDAVTIDDQLALIDGKDTVAARRALPVRIVNVMLGDAPYFQTDAGATYFIGSTLPDGAEVVAIGSMQIVFRREQRDVIYRLDN